MILREHYLNQIQDAFSIHRIVALLGPRQCGKTTLAHQYISSVAEPFLSFDLENPLDLEALKNPILTLKDQKGLIVIDEIQRLPEFFPTLRYIHDYHPDIRFLILGSASRALIRQSSESLAGRISYVEIRPFDLQEFPQSDYLMLRGGFPKSALAKTDAQSFSWRRQYIRTYVEQDLPMLILGISAPVAQRFWSMLSHYHGQIFNASEIANSLMIPRKNVQNYLDALRGTFMIRVLQPWFENIQKRQVKSPKIYFRDTGIVNYFWGISQPIQLLKSPKIGALWEGYALEHTIHSMNADESECFFWATHNRAELDLLILKHGKRWGFEYKYADAPKRTKSMDIALEDLNLDHLFVLFPGEKPYKLSNRISAYPLGEFLRQKNKIVHEN